MSNENNSPIGQLIAEPAIVETGAAAPLKVRAKFNCMKIVDETFQQGHSNRTVLFNAVYSTTGENADFAKATPCGELRMQIDKDTAAYDAFEPGNAYYLTFEKA